MKLLQATILTILLSITSLYAGAGHSHSVSDRDIKIRAQNHITSLINKNTVDSSWKNSKLEKMEERGIISKEWVVSFTNKEIKDKTKQRLFVYLTSYGKVKGANYKGD